ncbi:MAG: cytochrome P450 [Verrucomicrobiales bacterium]|nr:cytochrome P450 [Verrucomicrobiales bacterium]
MSDYETLSLKHFDQSQDHDQLAMLLRLQREESLYLHQGFWVLTRYADVNAGLQDKRLVNRAPEPYRKNRPFVRAFRELINRNRDQNLRQWFIFADSPRHGDARRTMRAEFNRQMPDLRRLFQSIADELLEKIDGTDEQSLRKGFVEPFPAMAAAELMGVPRENWRWFTESFGNVHSGDLSKIANRMESLLSETLANPEALRPGMLKALSAGCKAGNLMSKEEVLPNCALLSLASFGNTGPILEKLVGYLLRNPSEMERIHRDPSVLPAAVEEFIRCFGATSYSTRVATADVEIGGGLVPEGDWVQLALVAANHDPEVFENPDRIDLARHPNPHVAFGGGLHVCVAAAVARAMLQTSLACLARRFR